MDGLDREMSSVARVFLESLGGHKLNWVVRFRFKATNNMTVYKVLLLASG